MRPLKIVRLAALGLAISAAGIMMSSRVAAQQGPGQGRLSPETIAQIEALIAEKQNRSGVEQKIDSHLLAEGRMRRGQAIAAGVRNMSSGVQVDSAGRVEVEVRARVDADLLQQISARGIPIIASEPRYDSVLIRATLDDVTALAILPAVRFLAPKTQAMTSRLKTDEARPVRPRLSKEEARRRLLDRLAPELKRTAARQQGTSVGPNTSQGDNTHSAATARSTYGVTGAGIKIGVLSDGVGGLAASQSRGDLGAVTVLSGQAGSGSEGTAMLEIVHDLAPGADLYFATAFSGIASFASNIRALRNAGCDIIVDDVFYFSETPFQDGQVGTTDWNGGIVAQAVKDVVASGALYFAAAGNEGSLTRGTSGTWEGDFVSAGATSGGFIHDFGGGQIYETITVGSPYGLTLHWSDPLGASASDYDFFVLNSGGTVVGASTLTQNGSQDPYEFIPSSVAVAGNRIVIVKYSGSPRFLHLAALRGRFSVATAGEIHGHAATNSVGAFGVAATPAQAPGPNPSPFNSSNHTESFSSDGPRRIFYTSGGVAITPGNVSATGGTVLNKPDITAADGVSTGVSGFTTFYGTSAAAPHAAAIAALVKSKNPALTVAQMTSILTSTAIDIEAAGVDRDSGAGIVMANAAVQAAHALLAAAALTAPSQADPITTSSVQFTWGAISGALQYSVYVGNSVGASDISSQYTTGLALTATNIPVNDLPLYVRLWTQLSGGWTYRDYTFQRADAANKAILTLPTAATTIAAAQTRFTWDRVAGAEMYWLDAGTTIGGRQYNNAAAETSVLVSGYPLDGQPLYVRLWTLKGGVWRYIDYNFSRIDSVVQAVLTSPDPRGALTSATTAFIWRTLPAADDYRFDVGTSIGATDIHTVETTGVTATVSGIPINGGLVWVRLWARVSLTWRYTDYAFRTAEVANAAVLTAPSPVSTINDASTRFAWNTVSGAEMYWLDVGASPGARDVYSAAGANSTATVTGYARNGQPLYLRLWTLKAGLWRFVDYVFTTAAQATQAVLTVPHRLQTISTTSKTFTWNSIAGATSYWLYLGSSLGAPNLFNQQVSGTSLTVNNIQLNGLTLYVRMYTERAGAWTYVDYVFARANSSTQALLNNINSDATISTNSFTFTWGAIGGVQSYWVDAGTSLGGRDIYNQSAGTSTSATVNGIALNGQPLYVRLWTQSGGNWTYVDYVFNRL